MCRVVLDQLSNVSLSPLSSISRTAHGVFVIISESCLAEKERHQDLGVLVLGALLALLGDRVPHQVRRRQLLHHDARHAVHQAARQS